MMNNMVHHPGSQAVDARHAQDSIAVVQQRPELEEMSVTRPGQRFPALHDILVKRLQ